MPAIAAISHVTLTVTDLTRGVAWYENALGPARVRDTCEDPDGIAIEFFAAG